MSSLWKHYFFKLHAIRFYKHVFTSAKFASRFYGNDIAVGKKNALDMSRAFSVCMFYL